MASTTSNTTIKCEGAESISDLVRQCIGDRTPLVDYGLAHADLGFAPPDEHVQLRQVPVKSNAGVIEHYVPDLTVRAACGITIGNLQSALAAHNQILPVDVDLDITVGEAIHHNVYGPMRIGYGSLRDLLLGLHYIDGLGRDIHVGGRTVKNVAGYDLTRFMVGSLGEFGIVYEATLRTYALPQHVIRVELTIDDPKRLDAPMTDWLCGDAAPSYLLLHRVAGQWNVRLGYFGKQDTCHARYKALESFADAIDGLTLVGQSAQTYINDYRDRTARRAWRRTAEAVVKFITPPASTGTLCAGLAQWALDRKVDLQIDALPGHGAVFAGGPLDGAAATDLDQHTMPGLKATTGVRIWQRRPAHGDAIAPFAPTQSDWQMLRRLKHTMDPHRILNPGRFIQSEGST